MEYESPYGSRFIVWEGTRQPLVIIPPTFPSQATAGSIGNDMKIDLWSLVLSIRNNKKTNNDEQMNCSSWNTISNGCLEHVVICGVTLKPELSTYVYMTMYVYILSYHQWSTSWRTLGYRFHGLQRVPWLKMVICDRRNMRFPADCTEICSGYDWISNHQASLWGCVWTWLGIR